MPHLTNNRAVSTGFPCESGLTQCGNRSVSAPVDELINVGIIAVCQIGNGAMPAYFAVVQHRDLIGDGMDRRHVMGDRNRGRAHFGYNFADQIIDDARAEVDKLQQQYSNAPKPPEAYLR